MTFEKEDKRNHKLTSGINKKNENKKTGVRFLSNVCHLQS